MKQLMIAAVAVFAFAQVNAQEFKGGINLGLPIGDAGDAYTFNISADLSYLWDVAESFKAGAATGYSHSFLDSDFEGDAFSFIPIAAAARYSFSDDFAVGADLGYGLGISPSGNDGGFYYAPRLQYSFTESLALVAAYRGVSLDGGSFDLITLGLEFGF
ncbi:outer membrane beta-barrel protein [Paucihalobacter sp.]|uniref:outer membrane beta-barrel protein n=1 Tax=Paucihalobacter sp. TaxID=2850405 RepID=UPI002FE0A7B4